jgi:hypothetical protein
MPGGAILATPRASVVARTMVATRYVNLQTSLHSEVCLFLPLTSLLSDVVCQLLARKVQLDLRG